MKLKDRLAHLYRRILCWLWLDRLTFQYERGYADGLREGLSNADDYSSLTPEELEAVLSQPTPGDAP